MSITLNGTIPGTTPATPVVIIQANGELGTSGPLKFKFSAPEVGAYALNFCIGPASNPCGLSTSYVVTVPGGQERLAVVESNVFRTNVLVVTQGTSTNLPFSVTIE
jgi:hypothetical protein